jgi:hypothetical protein
VLHDAAGALLGDLLYNDEKKTWSVFPS